MIVLLTIVVFAIGSEHRRGGPQPGPVPMCLMADSHVLGKPIDFIYYGGLSKLCAHM